MQFDYAPDYKYYQSDVTRVFPANGKFTPRQREFYTIYLRLYQALMTSIKVHASGQDIMKAAVDEDGRDHGGLHLHRSEDQGGGDRVRGALPPQQRQRARRARAHRRHGGARRQRRRADTLEPGTIFTIEPAMQIADEHLGLRLEDMILITETGYENLSAFVPIEIDAIEKLMKEPGLSDVMIKR